MIYQYMSINVLASFIFMFLSPCYDPCFDSIDIMIEKHENIRYVMLLPQSFIVSNYFCIYVVSLYLLWMLFI